MDTQSPPTLPTSPETIRACANIVMEFTAWAQSDVKSSTDIEAIAALLRAQASLIRIVRSISGV